MNTLETKIIGGILGGAIGDAAGAPFELWTPEFITKNVDVVQIFAKTHKNDFAGQYTDDTEMIIGTIESINTCKCINVDNMLTQFKKNFTMSRGYGSRTSVLLSTATSTTTSVDDTNKVTNGGLMRISPIGMFTLESSDNELESILVKVLEITGHNSRESVDSCFIFCKLIHYLIKFNENKNVISYISNLINNHNFCDEVVKKINAVLENSNMNQYTTAKNINTYYSTNVSESLALVILAIISNDFEPVQSITNVIMYGGDTDTNAALVGTLCGIVHGTKWTKQFQNSLENSDYIAKISDDFSKLVIIKNEINLHFSKAFSEVSIL